MNIEQANLGRRSRPSVDDMLTQDQRQKQRELREKKLALEALKDEPDGGRHHMRERQLRAEIDLLQAEIAAAATVADRLSFQ